MSALIFAAQPCPSQFSVNEFKACKSRRFHHQVRTRLRSPPPHLHPLRSQCPLPRSLFPKRPGPHVPLKTHLPPYPRQHTSAPMPSSRLPALLPSSLLPAPPPSPM